jgi:hypothetical protein
MHLVHQGANDHIRIFCHLDHMEVINRSYNKTTHLEPRLSFHPTILIDPLHELVADRLSRTKGRMSLLRCSHEGQQQRLPLVNLLTCRCSSVDVAVFELELLILAVTRCDR